MGNIYRGLPKHIALRLRDEYSLRNFIETGSNQGATMMWAGGQFNHVISIELHIGRFNKCTRRAAKCNNIVVLKGDSRDWIGHVLSLLTSPALIWLDAHWDAGLGYSKPERGECPVMEEIDAINKDGKGHVIMIDDAHQFENPPNDNWPNFDDVVCELLPPGRERDIWVQDDVIIAIPMWGE